MFEKIKIVLFNPRLIGLLIGEKFIKSILMMFICIAISLVPFSILVCNNKEVSSSFKTQLVKDVVSTNINNAYILNYTLYIEDVYVIECDFYNIMIGGDITSNSLDALTNYILHFDKEGVNFYISNVNVYTATYENLNTKDLDFSLISTNNIIETNKFIYIFNQIYSENNNYISAFYIIYNFIDLSFIVFMSALTMACLSIIFNKSNNIMPFKLRYKSCLNCQYIYLLFILLSFLYSNVYLQYLGNIIMVIYTIISMNSIIMIKKEGK